MKNFNLTSTSQDILNTTADATAMRMFVMLVFLLLSCSGVFGQQAPQQSHDVLTVTTVVADKDENVGTDTTSNTQQLELVQWFMGGKQISPVQQATKSSPKADTAKKILINAGMTPNRILSRTLLKKAMQFENNIA